MTVPSASRYRLSNFPLATRSIRLRSPILAKLENASREALNKPGRPGVRQIAERFGVDPGTVQRISRSPFRGRRRKRRRVAGG